MTTNESIVIVIVVVIVIGIGIGIVIVVVVVVVVIVVIVVIIIVIVIDAGPSAGAEPHVYGSGASGALWMRPISLLTFRWPYSARFKSTTGPPGCYCLC